MLPGNGEFVLLNRAEQYYSDIQEAFSIGSGITFNSNVTLFTNFYYDFGIGGVLLFSLLIGYFGGLYFKRIQRKYSFENSIFYTFYVIIIMTSFLTFPLAHIRHGGGVLIYILIVLYDRIHGKKEKVYKKYNRYDDRFV